MDRSDLVTFAFFRRSVIIHLSRSYEKQEVNLSYLLSVYYEPIPCPESHLTVSVPLILTEN